LFSNAWKNLYPDNTIAAFMVELPQPIELAQNDYWEVELQGGSIMTGTDLCANKPQCAAAARP